MDSGIWAHTVDDRNLAMTKYLLYYDNSWGFLIYFGI